LVPTSKRIDDVISVDKHAKHNDNADDADTNNAGDIDDTDDNDTNDDDDDDTNDSDDDTADDDDDDDSGDKHNATYTAGTDNGTAANKSILATRESINTSSIHCGIHQPHYRPDVGVSRQ
jgi:hypothetical protein